MGVSLAKWGVAAVSVVSTVVTATVLPSSSHCTLHLRDSRWRVLLFEGMAHWVGGLPGTSISSCAHDFSFIH